MAKEQDLKVECCIGGALMEGYRGRKFSLDGVLKIKQDVCMNVVMQR
jgi:hypothetical protein